MSKRSLPESTLVQLQSLGVTRLRPRIVSILPHDAEAPTRSLAWHDDHLYESTGSATVSTVRRIDPADGTILHQKTVAGIWAEGLTVLNGALVQLTRESGVARVCEPGSLEQTGEFTFDGDGGGLTNDGQHFVMSDGTDRLCFRDSGFEPVKNFSVGCDSVSLNTVSDVEFGDGKIFANVPFDDTIYEVSAETGRILRMVDCSALREIACPEGDDCVLNGIGFEPGSGLLYVTGRNWRYLFVLDVSGIPVV